MLPRNLIPLRGVEGGKIWGSSIEGKAPLIYRGRYRGGIAKLGDPYIRGGAINT